MISISPAERQCENCKTIFAQSKPTQKYCSPRCQNTANHRRWTNKNKKLCPSCNCTIAHDSIKCSSCSKEKEESVLLESTLEGIRNRAKYQAHAEIRNHARRVFKKSNSDENNKCQFCGYNIHYEVCHKKAIKDFPKETLISVINDPENLIALCPNHHWEYDHGLISL